MLFRHRILCHAQCFQRHGLQTCAGATGAFREAHWYQGRPWAAAYSVLVNGNNIWEFLSWNEKPSHLHLHGRHSALPSWPPELSREECSWKNKNKHQLFCSGMWLFAQLKLFLATYTKFNLDVPQVEFWQLEDLLLYPDWSCIFREGYVSFGYKILIISCWLHKRGQLSYFAKLSLDPWEKQACFYSRKGDTQ